jgi:RNase P/RNase MRP subunit p30
LRLPAVDAPRTACGTALDDAAIAAVEASEMDPGLDHLNAELMATKNVAD